MVIVGPEETPFGIQKDLLVAKSPYYRRIFAQLDKDQKLEAVVSLPEYSSAAFGCFQSFIYTGKIYDGELGQDIPDYNLLLNVWKLATHLEMPPLRVAVLSAMAERRVATSKIPGVALFVQAWDDTEEGSGLRMMMIGWAAEHSEFPLFELPYERPFTIPPYRTDF